MYKFACSGMMLSAVLVTSCTPDQHQTTENKTKTPIVTIAQKDISLDKTYVSEIQAIQNVEIRSRISGYLEGIHVDEGQLVRKGQLLFTIDDKESRAELAKARAQLSSAMAEAKTLEFEVSRIELLVNKKIVSSTELDVAKAKWNAARSRIEEAKAAVNFAETQISYTKIRSPFDGILDRIPLKRGSLLEEGTLITTISDVSSVFAYFNISESEYLDYLRKRSSSDPVSGDSVKLILADGSAYPYNGKIETVVSEFEEKTGSIAFRARFPNPEHLLKHGATGKISLSQEFEGALLLPQKAVFEIQDKNYVYLLDGKSNKVYMRSFIPKARFGDFYIVGAGLQQGDKIVYEGIQNIREGMSVVPSFLNLDSLNGQATRGLF